MDSGNLVINRNHDFKSFIWSRDEIYTKIGPPKGPAPTKKQKEIMEHNKKVIEHERKKKKYMKGKIEVHRFESNHLTPVTLVFIWPWLHYFFENNRIQDRIKQFVAEIEKQASDIQASENPDLIEMMPKLLKVNFKPMDDIWRAIGKKIPRKRILTVFASTWDGTRLWSRKF